ncbi:MAG: GuaB1 family IMP dehydrogenase-related protein [Candidatus Saccharimonadales bacterium]|jgi:IMP dehydrogenase
MRFINNRRPAYDLTYSDVFLVPGKSDAESRFAVDLKPHDNTGATLPLIVANMNAVAGKRMAETVARRGALTVLPQDIPLPVLKDTISYIKSRHLVYETPLLLEPTNTIADALNIIHKRSHESVIVVDAKNRLVGIFKEKDGVGYDRFTPLASVMKNEIVSVPDGLEPRKIFELLRKKRVTVAPVISKQKVIGVVTQKGSLRSTIYTPATDRHGWLAVAVAVGINGNLADKVSQILALGADIIVLDTAHGHQAKMIRAIKAARSVAKKTPLVAGNVATADATKELIEAGADIIKVGVGPGAMCTTRMMTGVGRPQFSAVLECAAAARQMDAHIWADGGIRYPRDVALALAAGASNVLFGSLWAGTYESAADTIIDSNGKLYKENFGMASKRAIKGRNQTDSLFEQAKKEFFEEGISSSKAYLNSDRPGAEDIIDWLVAGLRSSMTYIGASNLEEFYQKAVVGIQSDAGYREGMALETSWV